MEPVTSNHRRPRTEASDGRTFAPSRSVEPKHWYLTCTRLSTVQTAGQYDVAGSQFGEWLVGARPVPQSAPKRSYDADYRNNRRQQGAEPVRFSNGQQWTWTHAQAIVCSVAFRSADGKLPTQTHQIRKIKAPCAKPHRDECILTNGDGRWQPGSGIKYTQMLQSLAPIWQDFTGLPR
jgi:hypothetical protein